ncbi:hypothetical protein AUP68_18108 [Ilyonectria robusta]
MTSTHASILPDYGNPSATKKVDFCIYVNPSNESRASAVIKPSAVLAIDQLCHELPCNVFNFTEFVPLERQPIALSIETKKPGEGWEGARLQLGVIASHNYQDDKTAARSQGNLTIASVMIRILS